MTKKICLITGVGPGTGSALVATFVNAGYTVAMIARNQERLEELESQFENCKGFPCDVSNAEQLENTITSIQAEIGSPEVVVHNAVGGAFGSFMDITAAQLQKNFEVNTMALLRLGQLLAPAMIEQGKGAIICTGNTSAYRGKAHYAGFAPTKAAQRILAESMARTLGPQGVHVAYVAIDAVIDVPWARQAFADQPDDFFCKPVEIAQEVLRIAEQPKSTWSFNVEIRPFGENW